MNTSPPAVSRALRAHGFHVLPQNANDVGIRVRGYRGSVRVVADFDSLQFARDTSEAAAGALRVDGYAIHRVSPIVFYVTGRSAR